MSASPASKTQAQAWTSRIYSGGWIAAHGGQTDVVEPATGAVLGTVGVADSVDVSCAARSAHAARDAWAAMPFDRRAAVLREAARLLQERAEEINSWNMRECGSVRAKAEWELNACHEQLLAAAALPMQPHGQLYPSVMPGRMNLSRRVPLGTVGVIAPWNFPLLLSLRSVAPALALGNAVVLKPDVRTAVTGGQLIAQLFADAGLPEGVLHVLPGGPDTGDALVRHPLVEMISFTGSTVVGRRIGEVCGGLLKKVALELGGNNAIVVLDDADLDAASSSGAWGAFLHQGQICMQAGRHLVHRRVAEAYAERLVQRAQALRVGNPHTEAVHLGPIINAQQLSRIAALVQCSVDQGARVLAGGTHDKLFHQATVLADVRPGMPAFDEEIFGPVAPITVFDSDEEAAELVNASPYGLAAAIHSGNVSRAMALADRLHTGMIHINDQTVNNEFHVPFGGMGASGSHGRFGGPANLEAFTQGQWISVMAEPITYPF
ncbi:benzaldehyde dehydrogenase [Azohydromonas australica]|uniref:benzaldehyde dehydrogenase n=1 Tax=Azohydromonas australica TaxID=364039 RepID=UPI0003F8197D|nr:benzaldehyde dehydrogenase [Azohydromonas australica]